VSHVPPERAERARPVRILSVPLDVPLTVLFLGEYVGLLTHWVRGRSLPCPGVEHCPPAVHRTRRIWKGYAPVEAWFPLEHVWIPAVLEITEALEEVLHGTCLRGSVYMLSREREGRNTHPVIGLFCEKREGDQLRQAFNVAPVLQRFYHAEELHLGVPNPIPPRLMFEPSQGRIPSLPAVLAREEELQRPAKPGEIRKLLEQARQAGLIPKDTPVTEAANGQRKHGQNYGDQARVNRKEGGNHG